MFLHLLRWSIVTALVALAWPQQATAEPNKPICLHPDNPHYFLFRGKPAVLITSGEHYGAVLNLDFDYRRYLDELQARGLNLTRTFSGTYREIPGSFTIIENTLGPMPGRYACPWARSKTPGAADGGAKFDLKRWDPAYFQRLKDFLSEAGKRGIVVELVLFCTFYDEGLWNVNPMNARNNTDGIGKVLHKEVLALKDENLTRVQEALVHKIAAELKGFDNVYYEICNEPYFAGVTREWSDRIAATLVDAESAFPAKHLIAQNIANGKAKIVEPNSRVSIFNFHYASPPDTVAMNYGLGKVIADDETGFKGKEDFWYRREGWEFILAGGAAYSNLDYSFTCSRPDGTFTVTTSPGGGGPSLRSQLKILKQFIDGFDFLRMKPDNGVLRGEHPRARALVETGKAYAIYLSGGNGAKLQIELPAGSYKTEWINTKTGNVDRAETFQHSGGERTLVAPNYVEDIALRIRRSSDR